MSYLYGFFSIIHRDFRLAICCRGDIINPLFFFGLTASLFPLALGPSPELLRSMGGGVIWVSALLACVLASSHLFQADFDDGALDLLVLSPYPLWLLVLAKIVVHWMVSGLPITVLSPLLAVMFGLPQAVIPTVFWTLLVGTPVLSLVAAVGSGLTVALRGGGILLALLTLPLYVPVLIIGTGCINTAQSGAPWLPLLLWQGVLLALGITLAPLATAGALKISAGA